MRKEGWEHQLHLHIEAAKEVAFAWGEHDCALWSAEWVRKATGADHIEEWLGKYSSETELLKFMGSLGYKSPRDIADKYLERRKHINFAQRGDIVLHPIQESLGVCDGVASFFVMGKGLTRVPTNKCIVAWKVE